MTVSHQVNRALMMKKVSFAASALELSLNPGPRSD